MRATTGGSAKAHDKGTGKQRLSVGLSKLSHEALAGSTVGASAQLERALRFYLQDRSTDRPAWPYPDFLRGSEASGETRVDLEIDPELLNGFAREAARQSVSTERLAEHAAFYFAAELDAGRVTERILADLDRDETAEDA